MNKLLAQNSKQEKIEALTKIGAKLIGPNHVQLDGDTIFVTLPKDKDNTSFLLKIILPENFPLEPADYIFVNPETKSDDSPEFWPKDNEQAFKIDNQNPRWICLAGTNEYKIRHGNLYDPNIHTLSQTVVHIYRQINGVIRVE